MDFVIELLLTAVVALLFSFLIAKLVSVVHGGYDSVKDVRQEIVMEDLQCSQHESKVEGFKTEKRVAFVADAQEHVKKVEERTVDAREDEIVTDFNRLLDDDEKVVGEGTSNNFSEFPERSEAVVEKEEVNVYTNSAIERSEPVIEKESGVESLVHENDDVTGFAVSEEDDEKDVIEEESEPKRIENVNTNSAEEISEPVIENESGVESLENENDDVTDFAVPEEEDDKKAVIEQENESKRIEKIGEVVVDEDDDWEGIERSELEQTFAAAAKFVNSGNGIFDLSRIGSDVQMELYGLHKVATEGPCRESQPMALMMSARAKWNAWQRLGNMNPELAMEQYISVLSEKDPSWMEKHSAVMGDSKWEPSEAETPICKDPDLSSLAAQGPPLAKEHTPEMKPNSEGGEVTSGSSVGNQAKMMKTLLDPRQPEGHATD